MSAESTAGQPQAKQGGRSVGRLLGAHWIALLLTIVLIVLIAQNRVETSFQVFWLEVRAPLWFLLVCTALVGAIVGVLGSRRRRKARD